MSLQCTYTRRLTRGLLLANKGLCSLLRSAQSIRIDIRFGFQYKISVNTAAVLQEINVPWTLLLYRFSRKQNNTICGIIIIVFTLCYKVILPLHAYCVGMGNNCKESRVAGKKWHNVNSYRWYMWYIVPTRLYKNEIICSYIHGENNCVISCISSYIKRKKKF